jgi:hypothetical protein
MNAKEEVLRRVTAMVPDDPLLFDVLLLLRYQGKWRIRFHMVKQIIIGIAIGSAVSVVPHLVGILGL